MKIQAKWYPSKDGVQGEAYTVNRIRLARIWKRNCDWQISISLPDVPVKQHLFPTAKAAKDAIETAVERWFDLVDA